MNLSSSRPIKRHKTQNDHVSIYKEPAACSRQINTIFGTLSYTNKTIYTWLLLLTTIVP